MAKRTLTKEIIIQKAFELVDKFGSDQFSIRGLARELDVQVSSLYNHIKNEHELLLEVAKKAAVFYTEYIDELVVGLPLDEATYKASDGFRSFVHEHKFLYELLIDQKWQGEPEFEKINEMFTIPLYNIIKAYGITDKIQQDHLYILMRVVTHGFASLDTLGVFDRLSVNTTESYHILCKGVIDLMKSFNKAEATDNS